MRVVIFIFFFNQFILLSVQKQKKKESYTEKQV